MWLIVRRSLAVAFLLLWALSTVFWIRSYAWVDSVRYIRGVDSPLVLVYSRSGLLAVSEHRNENFKQPSSLTASHTRNSPTLDESFSALSEGFLGLRGGLNVVTSPTESFSYVALPYWFLSIVTGLAGLLLTVRRPYRFTVRGMLIATTIVAFVLGAGIVLRR